MERGVSHKFDQEREEMASDIACGQVESAMEVMSEGEEVGRNGIEHKRDCRIVESVEVEEVSEVNRGQSEGCTESYSREDIREDAGLHDGLSKDPDRDGVHLKVEVQRSEIAPNIAESTSNGGHGQEEIDRSSYPRIVRPAQVEACPPENTDHVPYRNLNNYGDRGRRRKSISKEKKIWRLIL